MPLTSVTSNTDLQFDLDRLDNWVPQWGMSKVIRLPWACPSTKIYVMFCTSDQTILDMSTCLETIA